MSTTNDNTLSGAELLDELREQYERYVIFPDPEAYDAVTLWTAASHVPDAWEHAPRLTFISPEKQCGKSRALDITEATCFNPLMTVNISAAALVRSVKGHTLLLDEADAIFGTRKSAEANEDLRGILNAGHQKGRPYRRWNSQKNGGEIEDFDPFAFAALASIGSLPDTIMDRSVIIPMRRRAPGEKVSNFRTRDAEPLKELGGRVGQWLQSHQEELKRAIPDMPVEDRKADTWEPLIVVADLAGEHWPARARQACIKLTSTAETDTSAGVRLLADIHAVFGAADKVSTTDLITRLCKLEESPWSEWHGRNITPRDIAELLKPYGVRSLQVRTGDKTLKGYHRDGLSDAWERYLPQESETSETRETSQVSRKADVSVFPFDPKQGNTGNAVTSTVSDVSDVSDMPGECETCHTPMTVIEPGQRSHPGCEPDNVVPLFGETA